MATLPRDTGSFCTRKSRVLGEDDLHQSDQDGDDDDAADDGAGDDLAGGHPGGVAALFPGFLLADHEQDEEHGLRYLQQAGFAPGKCFLVWFHLLTRPGSVGCKASLRELILGERFWINPNNPAIADTALQCESEMSARSRHSQRCRMLRAFRELRDRLYRRHPHGPD
jgi:hypothetical protein